MKHEIIDPLGVSVTGGGGPGRDTGDFSARLNERAHLSSEMAVRIGTAFGVLMDTRAGLIHVAPFNAAAAEPLRAAAVW